MAYRKTYKLHELPLFLKEVERSSLLEAAISLSPLIKIVKKDIGCESIVHMSMADSSGKNFTVVPIDSIYFDRLYTMYQDLFTKSDLYIYSLPANKVIKCVVCKESGSIEGIIDYSSEDEANAYDISILRSCIADTLESQATISPAAVIPQTGFVIDTQAIVDESSSTDIDESPESYYTPDENGELPDRYLIEFLDARTYADKIQALSDMRGHLNECLLNNIAASLDIQLADGTLEEQYDYIRFCVQSKQRFEITR